MAEDEGWIAGQVFAGTDDDLIDTKRENLTDIECVIYDLAIHKFLQEQSARYRRLNSYGVREGVYMAITYLGVPIEQFEWVGLPIEELRARCKIYELTGDVTL